MGLLVAALAAVATVASVPPWLQGRELERLPTERKLLVLTIDAGANADGLDSILRTLRREGVPATFFLTGAWVERYPQHARRIGARHPVGNHSRTHPSFTRLSDARIRGEVERAERAIRRATGRDARPLFRFPNGDRDRRTIALVNRLGYIPFRWTVDTHGWMGRSRQSREGVVRRVLERLEPGAIVLMHVGSARDRSTLDADALPAVIRAARARGYEFATLERFRTVVRR